MYLRSHLPLELSRISPLAVPPLFPSDRFPIHLSTYYWRNLRAPAHNTPSFTQGRSASALETSPSSSVGAPLLIPYSKPIFVNVYCLRPFTVMRSCVSSPEPSITFTIVSPLCQRMNLDTLIPVDIIGKSHGSHRLVFVN